MCKGEILSALLLPFLLFMVYLTMIATSGAIQLQIASKLVDKNMEES
jgi:hypothetical protein